MSKKRIILIILFLVILIGGLATYFFIINREKSDAYMFSKEYSQVGKDNVFVYRNADEIINILEKGTGVVYLGFPECKWCQRYVKYLNEIALDLDMEKIYYYNISEDRKNNSDNYKKIVSILGDKLSNDEEGNPRIFVPDVTFVKDGKIVGHDNETSMESGDVDDYWHPDRVRDFKDKIYSYMDNINLNMCTDGCDN